MIRILNLLISMIFIIVGLLSSQELNNYILNKNVCRGKIIIANGISDLSKGLYIAKKRALLDAYRDAINRGTGVNIKEFSKVTITNSLSSAYSTIIKQSRGLITNYTILSSSKKNNLYEVIIKACVIDNITKSSKKDALKLFVNLIGSPKVLVIISQKELNETTHNKTFLFKENNQSLKTAETIIAQLLKQYGYSPITSDDLFGRNITSTKLIEKAREGIGGFAIQVARDLGVDILILGNLSYDISNVKIYDSKTNLITTSLNIKILMPGSGKVVGIYNSEGKKVSLLGNMLTARENSIKKAINKVIEKIAWDIPNYLLNEEREIEINFENVTYSDFRKIKKILLNEKEILNILEEGRWKRLYRNKGNARLTIQTSYLGVTVDDIIDMLEKNDYSFNIEQANKFFLKIKFTK